MKQLVFYIGLGMLFTHELDAMPNHEWRGIPILRAMPDDMGMWVFLVAHVPLFAVVIGFVASLNVRVRALTRVVVSAFLLVHGVLHAVSTGAASYEFSSLTSQVLIYGAAALGLVYLLIEGRARYRRAVL